MNASLAGVCVLAGVLLAGCSSMLPRASKDAPSAFATYEEVQAAAQRIVPFETPVSQLPLLGFDPEQGRNVTVIPYPEILARLVPYSGVPLEQLDPGIRACVAARAGCKAYLFHFERQDRQREGGFWGDFFNLKRETRVKGWWFETLVVVNEGTVLFRNLAGQPRLERLEREFNPLGPLQPAGEGVGRVLLR